MAVYSKINHLKCSFSRISCYALPLSSLRLCSSFYMQKTADNSVNIFHKHNYHITISLSIHCKTCRFAFRNRPFCTVKEPVLHYKRAAFAMPKRSYHFLTRLFLQKKNSFNQLLSKKRYLCSTNIKGIHHNIQVKT